MRLNPRFPRGPVDGDETTADGRRIQQPSRDDSHDVADRDDETAPKPRK
jgi:hypothetical protein